MKRLVHILVGLPVLMGQASQSSVPTDPVNSLEGDVFAMGVTVADKVLHQSPAQQSETHGSGGDGEIGDGKEPFDTDAVADMRHIATATEVAFVFVADRQIQSLASVDDMQAVNRLIVSPSVEAFDLQNRFRYRSL